MQEFVLGQRWVVDAEPELGLGMVVDVSNRAVTLLFPESDSERMYARAKAPLTRIVFNEGDRVHASDGRTGLVKTVLAQNGLVIYELDDDQLLPETQLAAEVRMNQPLLRLMTGQIEQPRFFALRRRMDAAMARLWQSQLTGLLGARANLIPHQLYVAESACNRQQVRVLLADEVGLGKTLEAGMILSRLLRTERINRALILVPDALLVQWLVEMIRRFQIQPTLYGGRDHEFEMGAIQLAPHSLLEQEELPQTVFATDLVIVDEAHHFLPDSRGFTYLQKLAQAPHLVLLTATPEQLGIESHFARLQLLDSAKFVSLEKFREQEQQYESLNNRIKALPEGRQSLVDDYQLNAESDEALINQLSDCHGIGRVMFRNTRASIHGFPERVSVTHPLASDSHNCLHEWLAEFLKDKSGDKVLVIGHSLEQVKAAELYLWQEHGLDVAVFHEDMDLVERDRAAAYFADLEMGAQALICSEIGSEGRNFQFSHILVCLDLPNHPDVLEQRIGRLDRIGQSQKVQIHIPCAKGSSTEQKVYWYREVLDCVDRQNPAAGAVHDEFWSQYQSTNCDDAIAQSAKDTVRALERRIAEGRDALLERNSCRLPQAQILANRIAEFEAETPKDLVESASDLFNFHFEETHTDVYSVIPADNMLIPTLPGIPPEGCEITFLREVANARDDVQFVSWDANFVVGLWELLRHSEVGSASVALLPSRQLPAGQCLLETCFELVVQAGNRARCLPFLNALSLRSLVLEISDKDLADTLGEAALESALTRVDKKLARKIIGSRKEQIPDWYQKAERFTEQKKQALIAQALTAANTFYTAEIERLRQLARQNPNVSEAEIEALHKQHTEVVASLENKVLIQLSAIRLIVTTEK